MEQIENVGVIAELGSGGDTKYTWDRNNPKEVEEAREQFNRMKAKGFLIFTVNWFGRRSEVERFDEKGKRLLFVDPEKVSKLAREFDPKEDYVATPAVAGG